VRETRLITGSVAINHGLCAKYYMAKRPYPRVARVEGGWIYAFSILPGPIKVKENYTSLGCVVNNIGLQQVPKDNIFREGDLLHL